MQETQATAAALMEVPGPETNNEITLGIGFNPGALKLKIQNDKEMREILTGYVRDELKEGHHFSKTIGTQQLAKPMLLDEGARNIVSLFNLFFGEPKLEETWLDDGHYRVRAHVGVFNKRGEQLSSGDALCSTRETKYAYRKSDRVCPKCGVAAIRKDNKKQSFYCWSKLDGCGANFAGDDTSITEQQIGRVDNPDLADVENTVLKIAIKRAKVAAVRDLPVVSEIFAPEGDGSNPDKDSHAGRTPAESRPTQGKPATSPAPPQTTESMVDRVVSLVNKLVERGAVLTELEQQFLPEDVASFEGLAEDQAADVLPSISDLLNSKIAKPKDK